MSGRDERPKPGPSWKPLPHDRRWYQKFFAQKLAQAEVRTPGGHTFVVRVELNSPVAGLADAARTGDLISGGVSLAKSNLTSFGDTGWTIAVLKPSTTWRSERILFQQHVQARAIVVDVIIAITDALERGDKLWDDDEDY